MTDKQIIIDYKNLCENYSKEVGCYGTFDGSCIKEQCFTYKLLQKIQQLKRSEAQCEAMFVSHTDLEKAYKAKEQRIVELNKTIKAKEQECEELKETFDDLFKVQYKLADTNKKLRQCLTEIKEIVGIGLVDGLQPEEYSGFLKILQAQILQKISECEG